MPHLIRHNPTLAEFVSRITWPAPVAVEDVVRVANQIDVTLQDGRIPNCGIWNGCVSKLAFAVARDAKRRERMDESIRRANAAEARMTRRLPSAAMMEAIAPGADEVRDAERSWHDLLRRRSLAGPDPKLSDRELDALLWAIRNVDHEALNLAQAANRFGDGCGYGTLSSAANEVERSLGVRLELRGEVRGA